jgi:putative NIF3 family GTP cyclohydrolase 1 type 2
VTDFTRRRFLTLAGASAAAVRFPFSAHAVQAPVTVQDVMTRVQLALGGTPAPNTIDGLKAGRADLRVTGIATAAMATVDVIRRASAAGCNLVITFEPTFFARADQASPPNRAADATFAAKRDLIEKSDVAVWRLHDQWIAQRPSSFITAFAEALQWQRYQTSQAAPERVVLPSMTLRDLVAHVQKQLGAKGLRVIGRPELPVTRVVLSPGPSAPAVTFGNLASADVILAGEPREWEGVEYVQDAIAAGQPKAMVLAGRVLTENPGMRAMATWLTELLPGMRVQSLAVPDPYWRPSAS